MVVIGVDVHKHSLTAVAVDEAGRMLDERTVAAADGERLAWARRLGSERLWALEDCRQLTRWLERQLLERGEPLVRVPPKLMAPERRAGRARGKSDPIDALAVTRAALREPGLSRPRPDEQPFRELKLLVDHRDDLVDERRRAQQRLRWHLHQLDPSFAVPARHLDRPTQLDRVGRWLVRREQDVRVRVARDLVSRCRSLTRSIVELDRELEQRTAATAPALLELPGCGALTAAKLLAELADRPLPLRRSSPATAASHRSRRAQAASSATGSTAAAIANSTPPSTGSRSHKPASTQPLAATSNASRRKARVVAKQSAAANVNSAALSSTPSKRAQP
jgi:transposase